jgi:serine/threonine protein kinase
MGASQTSRVESIGDYNNITIIKPLASGGSGDVYLVKANNPNNKSSAAAQYALKRMFVNKDDKEKQIQCRWEFDVSRSLPIHNNLVKCLSCKANKQSNGDMEYLLLLEYCSNGTLLDWLNTKKTRTLTEQLSVFQQLATAVELFHTHEPAISHRDLKPENLLRKTEKKAGWALCDFGSSSSDVYVIDNTAQRIEVQQIIEKNTTPSFRAPEMCDLYSQQPITIATDCWALGVILYQILFKTQPFAEGPLATLSGKYYIPENHKYPTPVLNLLHSMLTINYKQRANIQQIQQSLATILQKPYIPLSKWTMNISTQSVVREVLSAAGRKSVAARIFASQENKQIQHYTPTQAVVDDETDWNAPIASPIRSRSKSVVSPSASKPLTNITVTSPKQPNIAQNNSKQASAAVDSNHLSAPSRSRKKKHTSAAADSHKADAALIDSASKKNKKPEKSTSKKNKKGSISASQALLKAKDKAKNESIDEFSSEEEGGGELDEKSQAAFGEFDFNPSFPAMSPKSQQSISNISHSTGSSQAIYSVALSAASSPANSAAVATSPINSPASLQYSENPHSQILSPASSVSPLSRAAAQPTLAVTDNLNISVESGIKQTVLSPTSLNGSYAQLQPSPLTPLIAATNIDTSPNNANNSHAIQNNTVSPFPRADAANHSITITPEAELIYRRYRNNVLDEFREFYSSSPRAALASNFAAYNTAEATLDWLIKKCTKKDLSAVKLKYFKQIIAKSWQQSSDTSENIASNSGDLKSIDVAAWQGVNGVFDFLAKRPIMKNSIVLFRSLYTLHVLLQFGSIGYLNDLFAHRKLFLDIENEWKSNLNSNPQLAQLTNENCCIDLVFGYNKYLMRRVYFLYTHRQFEGNFSLSYYLYRLFEHPQFPKQWQLPTQLIIQQSQMLLQLIKDAATLLALILEKSQPKGLAKEALALRDTMLIPLLDDIYLAWLSATFLLAQVCLYNNISCYPAETVAELQTPTHQVMEVNIPNSPDAASIAGSPVSNSMHNNNSHSNDSSFPHSHPPIDGEVLSGLVSLIASHHDVTDQIHTIYSAAHSLPLIASHRSMPAIPYRINPFQAVSPLHFPPASCIPQLAFFSAQLSNKFQQQVIIIGRRKAQQLIYVDKELAKNQYEILSRSNAASLYNVNTVASNNNSETNNSYMQLQSPPAAAAESNPFGESENFAIEDSENNAAANSNNDEDPFAVSPVVEKEIVTSNATSPLNYRQELQVSQSPEPAEEAAADEPGAGDYSAQVNQFNQIAAAQSANPFQEDSGNEIEQETQPPIVECNAPVPQSEQSPFDQNSAPAVATVVIQSEDVNPFDEKAVNEVVGAAALTAVQSAEVSVLNDGENKTVDSTPFDHVTDSASSTTVISSDIVLKAENRNSIVETERITFVHDDDSGENTPNFSLPPPDNSSFNSELELRLQSVLSNNGDHDNGINSNATPLSNPVISAAVSVQQSSVPGNDLMDFFSASSSTIPLVPIEPSGNNNNNPFSPEEENPFFDRSAAQTPKSATIASPNSSDEQKQELDEFEISPAELELGETIGRGISAEVLKGKFRGTEVAIKKHYSTADHPINLAEFKSEVNILKKLRHPNIILFMGACTQPQAGLFVVTELMHTNLFDLLHNSDEDLTPKQLVSIAAETAKGMNYLHLSKPPIVHLDLKSPNILLDDNFHVRICDFGLAMHKPAHHQNNNNNDNNNNNNNNNNGLLGTMNYASPEIISGKSYSSAADVYSFGVILWELFSRKIPFHNMNPTEIATNVVNQKDCLPMASNLHPELQQLIKRCTAYDPSHRPSFTQLSSEIQEIANSMKRKQFDLFLSEQPS